MRTIIQITNNFFLSGPGQAESGSRRNRMLRQFVSGLILTAALAGCWYVFGKTSAGEGLKRITYEFLQSRLIAEAEPPVTLIDISELRPAGPDQVTPRKPLKYLLTALAAYKPKVIGVDIDFSPEPKGTHQVGKFMFNEDPEFFAFCLKSRHDDGIPIYLGVSRTQALPPAFWLGLPEYKELAAAIIARGDARSVAQSIGETQGLTMSAALSNEFLKGRKPTHPIWPFEIVSNVALSSGTLQEASVDYSMIQRLKDRRIRIGAGAFASPDLLKTVLDPLRSDIYENMVLVGDVSLGDDAFDNPVGRGAIPGIILHASAAYTATHPLYAIRHWWNLLADFLLAAALLAFVLAVRLRSSPSLDEEKLQFSLSWLLAGAVIVFGILVNLHRVLWEDCIVVALALLFHPFADKWFGHYLHWLHVPSITAEQESRNCNE
jgi:CHASE2 domain-containing sensor protein